MILRSTALLASIGFSLTLGIASCSSSSSNGTGGAGGGVVPTGGMTGAVGGTTGAVGGTTGAARGTLGSSGGTSGAVGGATGTAGTSGAGGTASCGTLPACVASVAAACPVASSACLVSASASGNTSTHDICFGNPATVKVVESVTNDPNTGAGTHTISVTKAGTLCYTLDGVFNAQDPVTTPRLLSFKNALGVEVATFSVDVSAYPNPTTVTCASGQPTLVTDFGTCGMPSNPEPDICTGGNCTAP